MFEWNAVGTTWDKLTTDFLGGDIEGDFNPFGRRLQLATQEDVSFGWQLGMAGAVALSGDGLSLAVGGPGWVDPDTFNDAATESTGFARTFVLPATSATGTPVGDALC